LGTPRGYERIDYQFQFTARTAEEHAATSTLHLEDLLEMFGEFATLNLLHAALLNYRIIIITNLTDNPTFSSQLTDLFLKTFPKDFLRGNFAETISRARFLKLRIKEAEDLILDTNGRIIRSPWNEKKEFDLEKNMFKRSFEILDPDSQTLIFQQQIDNLIKLVQQMLKILADNSIVYENELITQLSHDMHFKVTTSHIDECRLFVKRKMPDKSHLLSRIHIRSIDKIITGLYS
jgi:hypothetical protein